MEENKKKACPLCLQHLKEIDYKDVALLRRFISSYEKILPRKKRNVCAWHQRKIARAIKRARFMALLPYIRR